MVDKDEWEQLIGPYRHAAEDAENNLVRMVVAIGLMEHDVAKQRIQTRIKDYSSARKKLVRILRSKRLKKKVAQCTASDYKRDIEDIAGVRVVLDYLADIYVCLKQIERSRIIKIRDIDDYISNPKPGGYRSLHLETWVYTDSGRRVKCEIQLRTMNQDSWATKAHPLIFKKSDQQLRCIPKQARSMMENVSNILHEADEMALGLRDLIYENEQKTESNS